MHVSFVINGLAYKKNKKIGKKRERLLEKILFSIADKSPHKTRAACNVSVVELLHIGLSSCYFKWRDN